MSPIVCWIATSFILRTGMSFSWIFVAAHIFLFNYILQENLLNFVLSEKWAGRAHFCLDVVSILIHIQSVFAIVINPTIVYATSVLPLNYLSWNVKLGLIAYNRQLEVSFHGDHEIVNGNNILVVFYIGLFMLLLKGLILAYSWPFVIKNSIKNPRRCWYIFQPSFYK